MDIGEESPSFEQATDELEVQVETSQQQSDQDAVQILLEDLGDSQRDNCTVIIKDPSLHYSQLTTIIADDNSTISTDVGPLSSLDRISQPWMVRNITAPGLSSAIDSESKNISSESEAKTEDPFGLYGRRRSSAPAVMNSSLRRRRVSVTFLPYTVHIPDQYTSTENDETNWSTTTNVSNERAFEISTGNDDELDSTIPITFQWQPPSVVASNSSEHDDSSQGRNSQGTLLFKVQVLTSQTRLHTSMAENKSEGITMNNSTTSFGPNDLSTQNVLNLSSSESLQIRRKSDGSSIPKSLKLRKSFGKLEMNFKIWDWRDSDEDGEELVPKHIADKFDATENDDKNLDTEEPAWLELTPTPISGPSAPLHKRILSNLSIDAFHFRKHRDSLQLCHERIYRDKKKLVGGDFTETGQTGTDILVLESTYLKVDESQAESDGDDEKNVDEASED